MYHFTAIYHLIKEMEGGYLKSKGYVKLYRDLLTHPVFTDPYLFKLFNYCLLKATHKQRDCLLDNTVVKLEQGQFIWGRKVANEELNYKTPPKYKLSEKSWENKLKVLEKLGIVTRKTTNKYTVVTVVNWAIYQSKDNENYQQDYQEATNRLPTDYQQVTTDKNVKECNKNVKEIVEYLNSKTNKSFKYTTKKTQSLINARFKEGFTVDDFKIVIDKKCSEWLTNDDMNQYLRPETLFGTKFESYLNSNALTINDNQTIDLEKFL